MFYKEEEGKIRANVFSEIMFRISKQRENNLFWKEEEGKIRATVFSEIMFRIIKQRENKEGTCSTGKEKER